MSSETQGPARVETDEFSWSKVHVGDTELFPSFAFKSEAERLREQLNAAISRTHVSREAVGDVGEWLCVKCRIVYPGPPHPGLWCVRCPKCSGDCGPRDFVEKREIKESLSSLRKVAEEMAAALAKGRRGGTSWAVSAIAGEKALSAFDSWREGNK